MKSNCGRCGGGVEFEADQVGATVACPHCAAEMLLMPRAVPPPDTAAVDDRLARKLQEEAVLRAAEGRRQKAKPRSNYSGANSLLEMILITLGVILIVGGISVTFGVMFGVLAMFWLAVMIFVEKGNRLIAVMEDVRDQQRGDE